MANPMKFRADHVGKLVVPRRLQQAREQLDAGTLSQAFYDELAAEAAAAAVAMQIELRVDVVTSGGLRAAAPGAWIPADEVRFLYEHTRKPYSWPFKICLPAPSLLAWRSLSAGTASPRDLAGVANQAVSGLSDTVAALIADKTPYVQVDSGAAYDWLAQPEAQAMLQDGGQSADAVFEALRQADAAVFAEQAQPRDTTLALRLGRTGDGGSWLLRTASAPRIGKLFDGLAIDRVVLDLGGRVRDFSPLAQLPMPLTVVLGLIEANADTLEDTEAVLETLDAADAVLGQHRLALGTDKDFASATEEMQRRKLDLLQGCAHRYWGIEI
ncbi:5-methyltetrahydropteroyltriglutamate--homocysteine methyltransferase [Pigmentiphaga humi]|uniref:5-methyltetrahydropteroyltriglutamate--homocysteine methyltransferase n=1 Tax=Pigmentiphaga humi TaxID=2478468 RepID=A0A3P4B4H3_9BURK|nr:hypothetical protein [Pigmentiphaga humi]VCU70426.1 5-methyltetrahydropteroyltriglutamate--homocysteine methyltransferase [Pigmentiphaga humi]